MFNLKSECCLRSESSQYDILHQLERRVHCPGAGRALDHGLGLQSLVRDTQAEAASVWTALVRITVPMQIDSEL